MTVSPPITSAPASDNGSTNPTMFTPYSGWSRIFCATSLAIESTPTMTAFWTGTVACARTSSPDSSELDEEDGEHPEGEEFRWIGLGQTGDPRPREEEERPDRDEVEDADEIVRSRVTGPFLIAIVEAVQPCKQNPSGERDHEEQDLATVGDRVRWAYSRPEEHHGDRECQHQPG